MAYPSPELRSLSCAVPMGFVRAVVYVYAGGRRLCPASLVLGCIGDTRALCGQSVVWRDRGSGRYLFVYVCARKGFTLCGVPFRNCGLFYCRLPLPRRIKG